MTTADPPKRHTRLIIVLALILVAVPVAWAIFQWAAEPPDPSSFYTPPDDLPSGPPGTVIRDETIDNDSARVWRVLHTSTDPSGAAIAVSSVVIAPLGPAPDGGWPVVAWAHGTSGIASRCAPSLDDDGGLSRIPELDQLLAAGTVVVATDYAGLGTPGPHPYLIGEGEGRAVLDSVRAARQLLGAEAGDTMAVFGHSQGGHATLFAARLGPTYAPDLQLAGAAAMAPPTDLGSLLERDLDEPIGIVLTALAVASWSSLYPEAQEDTVVEPLARPFVRNIGDGCVATTPEGIVDLPDVLALQATFLSTDPTSAPGWSELLQDNSVPSTPIAAPLLIAQGLTDAVVRPDVTEAWVQKQCEGDAQLQFDTYAGVGHFEVRTVAAPAVVTWLLARVDGQPMDPGCETTAN